MTKPSFEQRVHGLTKLELEHLVLFIIGKDGAKGAIHRQIAYMEKHHINCYGCQEILQKLAGD